MRFLGSKFTQNALVGIPLGELKRSPDLLTDFRGGALHGRGKGRERKEEGGGRGEKEMGVLGKGRREGREGKREGRERERGKGRGKERGGGVCVIGVRGDRHP